MTFKAWVADTDRQRQRFGEPAPFADLATEEGYERHYRSGHTPLIECHDDPEAFDPPFASGAMLKVVQDGPIQVVATSEAYVAWARRRFFALRLEMELRGSDGA